ncbi:mulatexin-like [Humulus lupulus]|uniref:mulatexin-like n=1 Tax=Humulus lupulus TaxID=3486 RepID=UPI002B40A4A0|nr:mulatexin-like [Humulus lupulus]
MKYTKQVGLEAQIASDPQLLPSEPLFVKTLRFEYLINEVSQTTSHGSNSSKKEKIIIKYLGSSLLLLSLTLSLLVIVLADERGDHKCGPPNSNPPCGNTRCCSVHNFCGGESAYCQGGNCRYQCWFVAHGSSHDLPRALLRNNDGISEILSESVYNEMFKHMKDCPSQGFYNYDAFLADAASFPGFATTGDVATRKRELAAFFGQTSQATTGQWSDSIDSHAWGYCHINGTTMDSENDYCTSSHWPCASGKKYNSRGPVQLTE